MIENTLTNDFEDGLDLLVPGTKKRAKVLFQIKAELGKESDRGCALVAAAYLENELTELLDGFFVDQAQKARDSLFDFNGPAGTFSAKIKLAYALGLISTDIQKSLDLVRGLRNEFAHLHEPLTFAVPKIASRVVSLLPCIRPAGLASKDIFIEKIQSMAATIHLCIIDPAR